MHNIYLAIVKHNRTKGHFHNYESWCYCFVLQQLNVLNYLYCYLHLHRLLIKCLLSALDFEFRIDGLHVHSTSRQYSKHYLLLKHIEHHYDINRFKLFFKF